MLTRISAVAATCVLLAGSSCRPAEVRTPGGKETGQTANEEKPWWFGSKAGITDEVPAPWTPLQVAQKRNSIEVSPWGRKYSFGPWVFPDRIETRGSSILAGPIRLVARVDGNVQTWTGGSISLQEQAPGRVAFSQKASSDALAFSARTWVEYDGVIRTDWKLEPLRSVALQELVFEIPLKREYARYYHHFPGRWGNPDAGTIPENGIALTAPLLGQDKSRFGNIQGFRPLIWLGDEERGLAWFSESDKNWYVPNRIYGPIEKKPLPITEIICGGDQVILRLRLVSVPLKLSPDGRSSEGDWMAAPWQGPLANLTYTFGFQATPVKPATPDVWDFRITHIDADTCGPKEMRFDIPASLLDKFASMGVRTVCFHEHWTDYEGYYATPHGKDLDAFLKACHARGIQVLPYFGFLISDLIPEWFQVNEQSVVLPMYGGYRPTRMEPQPMQCCYVACYNSLWQDGLAAGLARLMDEHPIDGVYLDGTEYPWGCLNRAHGCGYYRPNGQIALSFPFFAVREMMRRIYVIVKQHHPEGQVNAHNSTCMAIPTLAYATSYWDGEQFGPHGVIYGRNPEGEPMKPGTFALDALPLDAFRTEFMGHQWGVPAELLWRRGTPCSRAEAYSFALLHDVLIREGYENTPTGVDPAVALELESRLWKLSDEFDRKGAEWLPYWKNQEYVAVSPEGAYVSLYRHPRNGVLAVISNLSRQQATVEVQLHGDALRLSAGASAHDALTKEPVEIKDGKMKLPLPSLGWKLVWVQG